MAIFKGDRVSKICFMSACLLLGGSFARAEPKIPKAIPLDESELEAPRAHVVQVGGNYDLESSNITFKMSSGGTSCYAVVQSGGKDVGAFLPHNSATNPNTEAAYPGLAKVLGINGLFQNGTPYRLGPRGVQRFRNLIAATGSMPTSRRKNCDSIMAKTSKDASGLNGVFKVWDVRPYGYDDMVSPSSGANGEPKLGHAVMRALQAGQSWPSSDQYVSFKGASARVADLAAGHGIVMMFDALLGQWDRYSGGNVTVALSGKTFYMFSADNGGATVSSSSWTSKHVAWMTRYPYEVVQKFNELEAFLEGRTAQFNGYKDPLVFVRSIGLVYDNSADTYRKQLLKNLKIIRAGVEKNVSNYGTSKAYYRLN